jgi:hypothetical protein
VVALIDTAVGAEAGAARHSAMPVRDGQPR